MIYSVVHYPKIDSSKIQEFRRRHDPYINLIDSHITLVFHVPDSESYEKLENHVKKVISNFRPFEVTLSGLKRSWDHWLFLLAKQGNQEIIRLHDELYSGILEKYWRKDIEFEPHIAIGLFTRKGADYTVFDPAEVELDQEAYNHGLKEAQKLNLDYSFTFDNVSLITLSDDLDKIIKTKELKLG